MYSFFNIILAYYKSFYLDDDVVGKSVDTVVNVLALSVVEIDWWPVESATDDGE